MPGETYSSSPSGASSTIHGEYLGEDLGSGKIVVCFIWAKVEKQELVRNRSQIGIEKCTLMMKMVINKTKIFPSHSHSKKLVRDQVLDFFSSILFQNEIYKIAFLG